MVQVPPIGGVQILLGFTVVEVSALVSSLSSEIAKL